MEEKKRNLGKIVKNALVKPILAGTIFLSLNYLQYKGTLSDLEFFPEKNKIEIENKYKNTAKEISEIIGSQTQSPLFKKNTQIWKLLFS